MQVLPISRNRLVTEVVELVLARPGRVRLALDGAPPTRPVELAGQVAAELRRSGRAAVTIDADDFLRPASVRLEFGREDTDELLHGWLDVAGLRREALDPAGPDGSGRVLPRLWDAVADRAHRDDYTTLPGDGVVVVAGGLLLGRGLPLDLHVHLRMGVGALKRSMPPDRLWMVPAYVRYESDRRPGDLADLLVMADHPNRPAVRWGTTEEK